MLNGVKAQKSVQQINSIVSELFTDKLNQKALVRKWGDGKICFHFIIIRNIEEDISPQFQDKRMNVYSLYYASLSSLTDLISVPNTFWHSCWYNNVSFLTTSFFPHQKALIWISTIYLWYSDSVPLFYPKWYCCLL